MKKHITKKANRKGSNSKTASLKPYPDFPLAAHATNRWYKKIRGRFFYYGKIADDPDGVKALEIFNREWPYLKEGRTPPMDGVGDGCTIKLMCNSFLTSKLAKLKSDELSHTTFLSYQRATDDVIEHFGKNRRVDDLTPNDFRIFRSKLAEVRASTTLNKDITICRGIFKHALDSDLIEKPVKMGKEFEKPTARTLRKARNAAGQKLFSAEEIHRILEAADPVMRAMVLLGVNCGFGNTDVANLCTSDVDLDNGWIDFPRPKTGVPRRVPLFEETVTALREAISIRKKPKDPADADLCFLTKNRFRWVRVHVNREGESEKPVPVNGITVTFRKLLRDLNINGRKGLNFYALRHNFETVGGECKDQVAVNSIMGHVDSSMAGVYREGISDDRLLAVTDTVHNWLWPQTAPVPKPVTNTLSPTAIGTPPIVVTVEYDSSAGKRKSKEFSDQYAARRFFVAKEVAGKYPSVAVEGGD